MRKTAEPRASSANRANRRDKTPTKASLSDNKKAGKDQIRQLNTEEYLDLLPRKPSESKIRKFSVNSIINLPEFQKFQSDHLVLIPQIISYPFYDPLRGSSAFSTTKFNRQAANNIVNNDNHNIIPQTIATVASAGLPCTSYSSVKRLSRSRQIQNPNDDHDPEQAHIMRPSSLRQMTSKFDSMACFQEVSRLVIFLSDPLA